MNELTFSPSGRKAGYAAGRQRSPGALAAALALNGGVFALILALPATQYVIDNGPDLVTHWVPIAADPPKNQPEPVQKEKPLQKPIAVPNDTKVVVPDQFVTLTGTGPATGGTIADLGDIAGLGDLNPPADPPRKAVFRAATQDPRYASAFHPDYPPALRRQGLEGSVTVRVTIDENGRVTAVEMVKATDRSFFEETRDQALRYWRFRPATSDGAPVPSQQTLTVQFHLED